MKMCGGVHHRRSVASRDGGEYDQDGVIEMPECPNGWEGGPHRAVPTTMGTCWILVDEQQNCRNHVIILNFFCAVWAPLLLLC